MSKLAHSNQDTIDEIERQRAIEEGNEDMLPDYPAHEQWDAIWTEIRQSDELARARRALSIHEFRLLLGIFARTACKPRTDQ